LDPEYLYPVMSWYSHKIILIDPKDEFKWFVDGFTTQEDLDAVLVPALERGILRSPELVLNGILLKVRIPNLEISYHPCVQLSDQR
jgi:hypothetical protein